MKRNRLSNYFSGVAIKKLSGVETSPSVSNQHEFNGANRLKQILGTERKKFSTKFIYLGQDENDILADVGFVTWYDARADHPKRSEYRLYYSATAVSDAASAGDLLVVAKRPDNTLLVIIVLGSTTFESHILWLFKLLNEETRAEFVVQNIENDQDVELNFASRLILNELGIEISETDDNYLEIMLKKFRGQFPSTRLFSAFARETRKGIVSTQDPDQTLIMWMDQEELLFRTLERYLVSERIKLGFDDVDAFVGYSLSIQNRRKSRVGYALENHFEQILIEHSLAYSRGKETEHKVKPDFIFPSIELYQTETFPQTHLTMLGVKATCKDRWRQVLSEAARIQKKHLLTLELGISKNQTDEMIASNLQLIIPASLHGTYKPSQQTWLFTVQMFLEIVRTRQQHMIRLGGAGNR